MGDLGPHSVHSHLSSKSSGCLPKLREFGRKLDLEIKSLPMSSAPLTEKRKFFLQDAADPHDTPALSLLGLHPARQEMARLGRSDRQTLLKGKVVIVSFGC